MLVGDPLSGPFMPVGGPLSEPFMLVE